MNNISTVLFFAVVCCAWGNEGSFDSAAQVKVLAGALEQHYKVSGKIELSALANVLPALQETPTSVELLDVPSRLSSSLPVRVRYLKGSDLLAEVSATYRAALNQNVFVARSQLAKGRGLSVEDFEVQLLDVLSLRQMPVLASADVTSLALVSPLPAGAPLTWNLVKNRPSVRKGSLVDVVAEDGGLKITTRAVAMADASLGEAVALRNLNTHRTFEGVVINENLAQVRF